MGVSGGLEREASLRLEAAAKLDGVAV